MSHDISHILDNWDYDPAKSYRKIIGDNGREKVQIRVDNAAFQGILQMELDGRPDGRQPYGYDFVLDYYRQALQRYERAHGSQRGFELDEESCRELFDESLRIYNRYVFLLQLQDYPRVVRDTKRNMELFRFVNTWAHREEDRNKLERWWPYIIRINATARALMAMDADKDFDTAQEIVSEARQRIDEPAGPGIRGVQHRTREVAEVPGRVAGVDKRAQTAFGYRKIAGAAGRGGPRRAF